MKEITCVGWSSYASVI